MSKVFSVIVPYYNSSRWLSTLRESISSNSEYILEVIIVDDLSSEDEFKEVKIFCDNNGFKLIRSPVNGGPAIARNSGAKIARGTYLAFHDADDIWLPNRLEFLNCVFDSRGEIDFLVNVYGYDRPLEKSVDPLVVQAKSRLSLVLKSYLQPSCFVVKREKFFEFSRDFRHSEDFAYQLELLSRGTTLFICQSPLTVLGRPQGTDGGLSGQRFKMRLGEIRAYTQFCLQKWYRTPVLPLFVCYSITKHLTRSFRDE